MIQYCNIGSVERAVRFILGESLLIGILLYTVPPTLAFIAAYVVFTAIVGWEPIYTLASNAKVRFGRFVNRFTAQSATGGGPVHSGT